MINTILFSGLILCGFVIYFVNFSSKGRYISSTSNVLHFFRRKSLIECKNRTIILGDKVYLIFIILTLMFALYAENAEVPKEYQILMGALILGGGCTVRFGMRILSLYYDDRAKTSKKIFDFMITILLFSVLYFAIYSLLIK